MPEGGSDSGYSAKAVAAAPGFVNTNWPRLLIQEKLIAKSNKHHRYQAAQSSQ